MEATAPTSQWSMWHVDTFAKRGSDCECFWHVAIELKGGTAGQLVCFVC